MLDVIINMSNGELKQILNSKTGVCQSKINDLFPIAGVSIITTLKEELLVGDIDRIANMISQKDFSPPYENPVYFQLNKNLVSSLTCKLGLNSKNANKVAELFLSFVINHIKEKTSNNKGDIDNIALLNLLSGNHKEHSLPEISRLINII